jgi:hypothetical protein
VRPGQALLDLHRPSIDHYCRPVQVVLFCAQLEPWADLACVVDLDEELLAT